MATIMLIVFSIAIGTTVMSVGQSYIEENLLAEEVKESVVCYNIPMADPLKQLQIKHLNDEISKQEYLELEKEFVD